MDNDCGPRIAYVSFSMYKDWVHDDFYVRFNMYSLTSRIMDLFRPYILPWVLK